MCSQQKGPNYEYKVKLAEEQRQSATEAARKTLAYHEKNPEKHPLYPDEWKKFWNRRYKEIQAGENVTLGTGCTVGSRCRRMVQDDTLLLTTSRLFSRTGDGLKVK